MTIVSHSRRFIFLKTRKTAGTSVEKWLAGTLRKGDWITTAPENLPLPVGTWDTSNVVSGLGRLEKTAKRFCRYALRWPAGTLFREHMTASDVRTAVGEDIWGSYTKIAVERDPWDRMLSLWRWRMNESGGSLNFGAFLDAIENEGEAENVRGFSNLPIYTIDGNVSVDRLLRYNVLSDELTNLCTELCLPLSANLLPIKKSGYRQVDDDPRILSASTISRISSICVEEIRLVGWDYSELYGAK